MSTESTTTDTTGNTDTEGTDTTSTAQDLGDAGRKALDAERAARKDAERRATEAEARARGLELADARRRVAADHGLSDAQAQLLAGDTPEAMAAHAGQLLAAFGDAKPANGRPRERLRPGASNTGDAESVAGLAEKILGS
jgi:hypothetical protein